MRIQLDYKINIDVKEGNKTKEKLSIFFREFSKSEKKEHEQLRKSFERIFKKIKKLNVKFISCKKKIELYELDGDYKKALLEIEKSEKLGADLEVLVEELDELGGEDKEEFAETAAKDRFNLLVSGKDKEKLEQYAEIKGFANLMKDLDLAKADLEKKQFGE